MESVLEIKEQGSARGHIQLASGKMFDPLNPDPELITIEDIAHAGANMCRYGGHCKEFFSVNEHSALVSLMLEMWGCSPRVQLQGLLHDADEALGLPDLPRPVKVRMAQYKEYGTALHKAVWKKFDLTLPMDPMVHVADNSILFLYERPKLMGHINDEYWQYDGELRKANIHIPLWNPKKARWAFLHRYQHIMKKIEEYDRQVQDRRTGK